MGRDGYGGNILDNSSFFFFLSTYHVLGFLLSA